MKSKILIQALLLGIFSFSQLSISAQKAGKLEIKWSFLGINEGYDHQNKCKVWVDGELKGESTETAESKPNKMKVSVPIGNHEIRIVNYAFYEGNWEEHSIDNDYSIDCIFDNEVNIKKKTRITLVFDIEKEEMQSTTK